MMKSEFAVSGLAAAATKEVARHSRIALSVADAEEREEIYRLRHEVYARELRQHAVNEAHRLRDALDDSNIYLIARVGGEISGFVSLTTPSSKHYSVDKYVSRDRWPFVFDSGSYEIRLLTVLKPHRGRDLATLLMYGAFRWVEAHGGTQVVAIGRREVVDMYKRCGLKPLGMAVHAGAVTYDLLSASTETLRERMKAFGG